MKSKRLLIALASGVGLTMTLLWLLSGPGTGRAADLHVCPSGCAYSSIQAAVDAAGDSDVIKVATGTYTDINNYGGLAQIVYIGKSVTVRGGYTTAFTEPPDPEANPTTLDAQGQGRVLYITGNISPTVEGLRITGGDATGLGGYPPTPPDPYDAGGGVYVISATATIRDNQVTSNTAEYFGGGLFLYASNATLSGNTVSANSATYWGGGLYLGVGDATLSGNTVSNNYALHGGGLCLEFSAATLSDNIISGNSAGGGGGLWLYHGNVTLSGNTISANIAQGSGGLSLEGDATLIGNIVSANEGRGLFLYRSNATLINNMIVDNQANFVGSGLLVADNSSPRLLHTTLARNTGSDGSGIHVSDEYGYGRPSTVALTNTILVSHTVGVYVDSDSTVSLEGTLWGSGAWANGGDWSGGGTVITGTVNIWGDPAFVDPGAGDYHIGPSSAAIKAGVDTGVTIDIDGDPRLGAPDIGADEYVISYIYLPNILKDHAR